MPSDRVLRSATAKSRLALDAKEANIKGNPQTSNAKTKGEIKVARIRFRTSKAIGTARSSGYLEKEKKDNDAKIQGVGAGISPAATDVVQVTRKRGRKNDEDNDNYISSNAETQSIIPGKRTPAVKRKKDGQDEKEKTKDVIVKQEQTDTKDIEFKSEPESESKSKQKRVKKESGSTKLQKLTKYPPGTTPFPDHPHPTPEECKLVTDLLSSLHGPAIRPPQPPSPDLLVTGCGEVPSVLDALVRTLLSANTNAQNSNRAFRGLVERFGLDKKGQSVNWDAVRTADRKDVYEAIKAGGLANMKSKRIQTILQQVWEEGQERKKKLGKIKKELEQEKEMEVMGDAKEIKSDTIISEQSSPSIMLAGKEETDSRAAIKQEEINENILDALPPSFHYNDDDSDADELSLDYLHQLTNEQAMEKLTSFDGIGFKTASCVMLFCMARESFAVDTHVFRISRFLNWVPPDKATRETTFWHLDAKIPDEYKYPLHQLFIKHGRSCIWCKARGPLTYEDAIVVSDDNEEKEGDKGSIKVTLKIKKEEEKAGEFQGIEKEEKMDKRKLRKRVKKEIEEEEGDDDGQSTQKKPKVKKVKKEKNFERCPLEGLVKRFHGTRMAKVKIEID